MVDHQIADRRVDKVPVNLWRGDISCSCGWTRSVESCVDKPSAYLGLRAVWVQHTEGPTRRCSPPSRLKAHAPGYPGSGRGPA